MPVLTVAAAKKFSGDLEALERELGAWALLGRPPSEYAGAEGWSYRTRSVEPNVVQIGNSKVLMRADDLLLGCKKRAEATSFQSVLLVGRADSNDIVIAHPSVSKLHARLHIGNKAELKIGDAASSNGTRLDEVLLTPDDLRTVTSGSVLTFGSCGFVLVPIDHLQRVLAKHII